MTPQQVYDNLAYIQSHEVTKYIQEFTFRVSETRVDGKFNVQISQEWTERQFYSVPALQTLIKVLGKSFACFDNHLSWWVK